jgi:hypothetical protein
MIEKIYIVDTPCSGQLVFAKRDDVLQSIKISYSTCKDVKIIATSEQPDRTFYTVTCKRAVDDKPFIEQISVTEHHLQSKPTHL